MNPTNKNGKKPMPKDQKLLFQGIVLIVLGFLLISIFDSYFLIAIGFALVIASTAQAKWAKHQGIQQPPQENAPTTASDGTTQSSLKNAEEFQADKRAVLAQWTRRIIITGLFIFIGLSIFAVIMFFAGGADFTF